MTAADKLRAMRIDHLLDWPDGLLLNAEQAEALIALVQQIEWMIVWDRKAEGGTAGERAVANTFAAFERTLEKP